VLALVLRGRARGALRAAGAIALVAGVLVAGAFLLQGDAWIRQLELLRGYQAPGLRRWGESFHALFLFQVHPFVTAGALLSAWVALRRRDPRWIAIAWPVLLLVVLRVQRVRYWVPAFPMLALLGAYGLRAIRSESTRRAVVACAVGASLAVGLFGLLPFLRRTSAANLAEAGAWLDAMGVPAAEVLTPRRAGGAVNPAVAVPILDLQTSTPLVHACEAAPVEELAAARESPLRFTWEWRCPPWYRGSAPAGSAVVLVTGDEGQPLPPDVERRIAGLQLDRAFLADEGVFEYRTLVRVYRAPRH
jgi:hypothetical protein